MKRKIEPSFGRRIETAAQIGVAKAIAEHKRAGRSIPIWQNGQVVLLPADEIEIPRQKRKVTKSKAG